jgi:hypothetical protein
VASNFFSYLTMTLTEGYDDYADHLSQLGDNELFAEVADTVEGDHEVAAAELEARDSKRREFDEALN